MILIFPLGLPIDGLSYLDLLFILTLNFSHTNSRKKEKGSILESECQKIDLDIDDILSGSAFGILTLEEQFALSQLRLRKKSLTDHILLT